MFKRLHVALVYNVKKDGAEEQGEGDRERRRGNGDRSIVLSPPQVSPARVDTYAEWDTEETIQAVKAALEERHAVTLIEADEEAYQKLLAVQPDIVFNIAEGWRGPSREAQIPALLEMLGIPYTGSDPLTLGICLDKSRAKEILSYYHVPTPAFSVVSAMEEVARCRVPLPAIVKPLHEGSSKGIFNNSLVRTRDELVRQVEVVLTEYEEPALVEKFLAGREFTVALLGNNSDLRVLPIVEIRFDTLPEGVNPIYSYEAKWVWDQREHPIDVHQCPANVDERLQRRIVDVCKKAYTVLRCRDWCRIDVRLDERGEPNVLELNPLPGILPNPEDHSCFPQAARAAGIDYNSMLNMVVEIAARRYGI